MVWYEMYLSSKNQMLVVHSFLTCADLFQHLCSVVLEEIQIVWSTVKKNYVR